MLVDRSSRTTLTQTVTSSPQLTQNSESMKMNPTQSHVTCAKTLVRSEAELSHIGARLADALSPGDCVLLFGEMGVGKSVFARAIARQLGVHGPMPSPTFTLMQVYDDARHTVVHMDLYRLADADEAYGAGIHDMLGADNICLIEWPDRFMGLFAMRGGAVYSVYIEYADNAGERYVTIEEANEYTSDKQTP